MNPQARNRQSIEEEAAARRYYEVRTAMLGSAGEWGYRLASNGETYAGCVCVGCMERLRRQSGRMDWRPVTYDDWRAVVAPVGDA